MLPLYMKISKHQGTSRHIVLFAVRVNKDVQCDPDVRPVVLSLDVVLSTVLL
jgi:hypothetical protein